MAKEKFLDYKGLKEYHSYTKEVINAHFNDLDNPHGVTAEQIGLGKTLNIDGKEYDGTKEVKIDLLPFIVGTQTTSTGNWLGTASSITELYDGLSIRYWLPYAGSGNATLNLTLANGNSTGEINCYFKGTTRLTTQFVPGSMIIFTYRKNISINGSTTKYTGWWAQSDYDNVIDYRLKLSNSIKAKEDIAAKDIIVCYDKTGYFKLTANKTFDITYPILYSSNAISASNSSSSTYIVRESLSLSNVYSYTATTYAPIYLKGTLNGNKFTPNVEMLTSTIPTEEDGYIYMLFGYAYSTSNYYLLPEHPLYVYADGDFQLISSISLYAKKSCSDKLGQIIDETYIKKISINGREITITKGNGDKEILFTQDTTYDAATTDSMGLMTPEMVKKLLNIEDNAQKNVNSDWDATEGDALILNKPLFEETALDVK